MLYELGVFLEFSDCAEDEVLRRYGNRLLNILSGNAPDGNNIKDFVSKLMKQPLEEEIDVER